LTLTNFFISCYDSRERVMRKVKNPFLLLEKIHREDLIINTVMATAQQLGDFTVDSCQNFNTSRIIWFFEP
jgi:hypothetical protein